MRHEVVLVEQLGSFGWLGYQSLRLADVAHDDVAHIGIQLLSRQLQILIRAKLFLPQLRQAPNLLSSLLHQLLFALVVAFVLCDAAFMVGLVCLCADRINLHLALPVLLSSSALGDSLRPGCIPVRHVRAQPGSFGFLQLRLRLRGPVWITGLIFHCFLLHYLATMLIVLKLIIAFDPAPLLRAGILLAQLHPLVVIVREGRQRWLVQSGGLFIILTFTVDLWRLKILVVCSSVSLIQVKRGSLI